MKTDDVIRFMHRILSCAPDDRQAVAMLGQLLEIVQDQTGSEPDLKHAPAVIRNAMEAVRESRDAARNRNPLTEEDLRIAAQRYKERKERERYMSRC
jgi:hypothetical protein